MICFTVSIMNGIVAVYLSSGIFYIPLWVKAPLLFINLLSISNSIHCKLCDIHVLDLAYIPYMLDGHSSYATVSNNKALIPLNHYV